MKLIDCQGFAGGMTSGLVEAGWDLIAKREEQAGFGAANCEAQRGHMFPATFDLQCASPEEWRPEQADLVAGNPPCSGFSLASTAKFRGVNSKVNSCMWNLVRYAARCRPVAVAFESVQAAYKEGYPLMVDLWDELQNLSGHRWYLTHVVHDAWAVGGPCRRRRYLWVATRWKPRLDLVPPAVPVEQRRTVGDAIGDLEGKPLEWHGEPDGHVTVDTPMARRIVELLDVIDWDPGEPLTLALRRWAPKPLTPWFEDRRPHLEAKNWEMGYFGPRRWEMEKPGWVISGAGPHVVVHPHEKRTMTYREISRLMGFSDAWRLGPLEDLPTSQVAATFGKGITVDVGRWLGTWLGTELQEGTHGEAMPQREGGRPDEFELTVR